MMVGGERERTVQVVSWLHADDSMMCVFTDTEGVIWAVVNTRMPRRAIEHIGAHARAGFDGVIVCSVDCGVR
jgi:hypothetical protein